MCFLMASSLASHQDFQRHTLESAEADAIVAEEGLRTAASVASDFEAAKLRDPFRRRFTAAWCYAEVTWDELPQKLLGMPMMHDDAVFDQESPI